MQDNKLIGMVREIDLLKHMLEGKHQHSNDETISSILYPAPPTYIANTSLEEVMPQIVENNVILVKDGKQILGIISKIDVLDFIYH